MSHSILWLHELTLKDLPQVGGKNASLGEMLTHLADANVPVPGGFATTTDAFQSFLKTHGLADKINAQLDALDINDLSALQETGKRIRNWIMEADFPDSLEAAIAEAYKTLESQHPNLSVAVRSSATAEDLPNASFAGQQETYLNVKGLDQVRLSIKKVFASLYNDRAIAYRVHQNFPHDKVFISAGIQLMIRSDEAVSGVMFTLDTESGFDDVIFITAAYGLGETIVQGEIDPDEFFVHKGSLRKQKLAIVRKHLGRKQEKMIFSAEPDRLVETIETPEADRHRFCLTEEDIQTLAQYALIIEAHYGCPMDIEWAKNGPEGTLYIVQARPETVKSQQTHVREQYHLKKPKGIQPIAEGRSVGARIGQGQARILKSLEEMDSLLPGDILVTDMTDPDWEPVMKRAAGIVTNRGGRTCHAAIIARELGVPAIVGAIDATKTIPDNETVTLSCAEGDAGFVYKGHIPFEHTRTELSELPEPPVKIMMNVGNPHAAFQAHQLPNHGVGLARLEFIINHMIGIHPKALLELESLSGSLRTTIEAKIRGYASPREYYIERLKEGIASIACVFPNKPVIVRLSDFKSNEYANLIGGTLYEPEEENPMLGFRGASRYLSDNFRACFEMECEAIRRVRGQLGFEHVQIMVPFVRTVEEARAVTELLATQGLASGKDGLKIMMMCELPSNAILADEFLAYFDGFSIGSNDLTQLTLGLDRDSALIAHWFDERNDAVKFLLKRAIEACQKAGKYIGICGQGPTDHPDLGDWLIQEGIESLSLNPDSVIDHWLYLSEQAKKD